MKRVLVTGSSGFVGRVLCPMLAERGFRVRACVRNASQPAPPALDRVVVSSIDRRTHWAEVLQDVDLVVHAAGLAHQLGAHDAGPYEEINAQGTKRLAEQAAAAGVERMIFVSSVKVNGEETFARPFSAQDVPQPLDHYGKSKWRGEQFLLEVAASTRLGAVIVRPPLVYGPDVRANFLRLLHWVSRGIPFPLRSVTNRRSLVSVWNLCDLLIASLTQPAALGGTWMVSDGEDLSTAELIRRIAGAMQRRPRLFPVPLPILRALAGAAGKGDEFRRLCSSLTVDVSQTQAALHWTPPLSMDEGLRRTTDWFLRRQVS